MAQTHRVSGVATQVRTEGRRTIVRYHSTDVISWDDKEIVLNSGGYRSATTKLRMNQASNQFDLGIRVFQEDYEWYVVVTYKVPVTEGSLTPVPGKPGHFYFENHMRIPRLQPSTT